MSVQRTEEDTFLHICSFSRHDIFLFVETYLEVVKRNTNTSLYKRQVHVENHGKAFFIQHLLTDEKNNNSK